MSYKLNNFALNKKIEILNIRKVHLIMKTIFSHREKLKD